MRRIEETIGTQLFNERPRRADCRTVRMTIRRKESSVFSNRLSIRRRHLVATRTMLNNRSTTKSLNTYGSIRKQYWQTLADKIPQDSGSYYSIISNIPSTCQTHANFIYVVRIHETLDNEAVSTESGKLLGWEVRVVESDSSWHTAVHGHSRAAEVRWNETRFVFTRAIATDSQGLGPQCSHRSLRFWARPGGRQQSSVERSPPCRLEGVTC